MNKTLFNMLFVMLATFLLGCEAESKTVTRKLFSPGNISTTAVEYAPGFSASGHEVFFTKSTGKWGTPGMKGAIYHAVKRNGKWTTPKLAAFSGQYDDSSPHLCNEDKTLYFVSNRPYSDEEETSDDIWKVEKDTNGVWGVPIRLSNAINSDGTEYSPRTDKFGNLYFASTRSGGYGQGDLYFAKKEKDTFGLPVNFGNRINTDKGEWNLEINDSGDVIIFEASEREQNLSSYGDLYISFKQDNHWSQPQNIKEINTTGSDLYAEFIGGDSNLYYSSSDSLKSTVTNIYSIEFKDILERYRTKALSKE